MKTDRTHHVTTTDGAAVGGAVHGQGPPLVFVQGVMGDGDLDWHALVGHLTSRFTCHLPSLRGRGLSSEHPDLSFGRLVDDVVAYVASIGDPTGLVGWSLGADLALAAAAQLDVVDAAAAVEPGLPALWTEEERAAVGAAVARMGELAAGAQLEDAARAFARFPFTAEDVAAAGDAGYFGAAARYVPAILEFFRQQMGAGGPAPDDPAVLGRITAPVLVLVGSHTKPHAVRAARHVSSHAPTARVRELPGAGHASPLTHPDALAQALADFFARAQEPA